MDNIIKKGSLEKFSFPKFVLHVYNSNSDLLDSSFIVEGDTSLILLEYPIFKDNIEEYKLYIQSLQ